jgi:DNA-binding transcriptional ArsR family regulator
MIDPAVMRENASRANTLIKAMANKWRLLILCHLAQGDKTVGELEDLLGIGQSALSQHLAILRRDGLVSTERQAKSIIYSLSSPEAVAVMSVLYDAFCRGPAGDESRRSPSTKN